MCVGKGLDKRGWVGKGWWRCVCVGGVRVAVVAM